MVNTLMLRLPQVWQGCRLVVSLKCLVSRRSLELSMTPRLADDREARSPPTSAADMVD